MTLEDLKTIAEKLPAVTSDVKWGHDLCFNIGGKMFLVMGLDETPTTASFKVNSEEFGELADRPGFRPAPYLARYEWINVDDINRLGKKELEYFIKQSYTLIRAKLPKKILKELGTL